MTMSTNNHRTKRSIPFAGPLRLILALTALTMSTATVTAHQPCFNFEGSPNPDQPAAICESLEISQVAYGELQAPNGVDYYAFAAPAGFSLDLGLVVSDVGPCDSFRPTFTMSGPGMTGASDNPPARAIPLPESMPTAAPGNDLVTIGGHTWERFEDFGVAFLVGPKIEQQLPGGNYLVAVYDPAGDTGSYGLTFGGIEQVSLDTNFMDDITRWIACEPGTGSSTPVSATPSA